MTLKGEDVAQVIQNLLELDLSSFRGALNLHQFRNKVPKVRPRSHSCWYLWTLHQSCHLVVSLLSSFSASVLLLPVSHRHSAQL